MTFLPSTKILKLTVLYKPYQKGNTDFFDKIGLSTSDKQALRKQIGMITATHQLDAKTLPIPAGKTIQQIIVLDVQLLTDQLDYHLLEELDTYLGFYTFFRLVFPDGHEEFLIHFKEKLVQARDGRNFKIIRRFQTAQPLVLTYQERDLDQFYDHLVKQTGSDQLIDSGASVKESIERTQHIEKLEKQAAQFKKKMYAEKAMRKQMELKKAYTVLLKEIEALKS